MQAMDRYYPPVWRAAGVLVGVLLCGATLPAQGPPAVPAAPKVLVADVLVQGNKFVPTQQIMAQIKTRPGGEFSPDLVQEDTRTLWATRQFANVLANMQTLPDGRVNVVFTIYDLPSVVQKIVYNGAHHLGNDDAINQLTGLRVGEPLNPIRNKMACQAIVKKLNEDGRPFASCELLRGDQPGDTEVIFNISEGRVAKISSIDFTGNTFVQGSVLATHIMSMRKILGFGGTLNPAMIEADVVKLEEYYKSFGYLDCKVSRELQWSADGADVVLVFHVQEGVRYTVGGPPRVSGANALPVAQVEQLTSLKAAQYYNQSVVDKDLSRIKDYYGYTGRDVRAVATPFFSKDAPGVCQVQYEVAERPPAKVGQVFIVGNERTRQNVILRQVNLFPGQLLSYPELRIAERNLSRLGIFKTSPDGSVHPTVTVLEDPNNPDSEYKDVLINVEEDNTGSLLFGAGINSDAGLTGSIVLNEHNFDITRYPTSIEDLLSGNAFRGAGQEFRIEAVPGTTLQRYTVSFREPFLFDSPYSLGVSGYYYTRNYNEYDETRLGGRVTLGRKLNQYWTANASIRLEDVGVNNVSPFAPQDFQSVTGHNLQVGFRVGATYDSRDSILRATEGDLFDAGAEYVTGDHNFPLLNLDYSHYFTVWQRPDGSGRQVLVAHSEVGWAGSNTPVYERFYAGGFRSIRGFQFRGVGPDVNGFKTGGDFMWLNSLEYQFPLRANDQMMFVTFLDSGTVESRFDIKDYRVTAGFGFRLVVPMLGQVPIALDFGFPIVKGPFDNDQVFSFWLGFFR